MELTFIDILLIVSIVFIIILYSYQNNMLMCYNNQLSNTKNNTSNSSNLNNTSNNSKNNTNTSNTSNTTNNNTSSINDEKTHFCSTQKPLGPIIGFHSKFKDNLSELGWRNWWFKHKNKNLVPADPNFKGTVTYNFLNNLENVKNIYL